MVCFKDELSSLKIKLAKAESEKLKLKLENESLEIRVSILEAYIMALKAGTTIVTNQGNANSNCSFFKILDLCQQH